MKITSVFVKIGVFSRFRREIGVFFEKNSCFWVQSPVASGETTFGGPGAHLRVLPGGLWGSDFWGSRALVWGAKEGQTERQTGPRTLLQ